MANNRAQVILAVVLIAVLGFGSVAAYQSVKQKSLGPAASTPLLTSARQIATTLYPGMTLKELTDVCGLPQNVNEEYPGFIEEVRYSYSDGPLMVTLMSDPKGSQNWTVKAIDVINSGHIERWTGTGWMPDPGPAL